MVTAGPPPKGVTCCFWTGAWDVGTRVALTPATTAAMVHIRKADIMRRLVLLSQVIGLSIEDQDAQPRGVLDSTVSGANDMFGSKITRLLAAIYVSHLGHWAWGSSGSDGQT